MKKLLVLALVLGMASAASATLSLGLGAATNTDAALTVNAVGESAAAYFAVEIVGDATMTITKGPAAGSNTAWLASLADLDPTKVGEIWIYGIGVPPEVWLDGVYANIAVTKAAAAPATVNLYSYDGDVTLTPLGSAVLPAITPEPMTLGLLGIGGLFLRRRK